MEHSSVICLISQSRWRNGHLFNFESRDILGLFLSTFGVDLVPPPARIIIGILQGRLSTHHGSRIQFPQDLSGTVEELANCCRVMWQWSVLHEAHVLISVNVMKTWNKNGFQNFKVPLCIHRVPEDLRTYERVNCDSRPNWLYAFYAF